MLELDRLVIAANLGTAFALYMRDPSAHNYNGLTLAMEAYQQMMYPGQ